MKFMVLVLLVINLIYIKRIEALPLGVDRVEIGNWTKTREINEIEEGEKKLNSEYLTGIENINVDESLSEFEIFNSLYTSSYSIRAPKYVSSDNYEGNQSVIKGNKVLRTKIRTTNPIYSFDYKTMSLWVGSDIDVKWQNGSLGSKIITWPCYVKPLENNKAQTPVEWRMIEGEFELDKNQLNSILSKKVQPVLGIESDNDMSLVIPFSDILNIFINGEITDLNYRVVTDEYKFRIGNSNNMGSYKEVNAVGNEKYCNKERDEYISNYTNNKHIDCNILKSSTNHNYYEMIGDISQYIKPSINKYKISLLIGQVGRYGKDISNYKGGVSKLSLYLIENPKFKVKIKPYIMSNNEKVYISEDYKFSYNEKILFDMEVENQSLNYDYSNLDLKIGFIKSLTQQNMGYKNLFQLNKNDVTYNGTSIKDNVRIYVDNKDQPYTISKLSDLNKKEKITISSDKFFYKVTEDNTLKEIISCDSILEFNYIDKHIYYKYEDTTKLNIKPIGGRITVSINSKEEDYFYMKLEGENNLSNIKVESNQPYTIYNLDYDTEYKLTLLNSTSYKPVSIHRFTLKNSIGYNKKSIVINVDKKTNNYFTQRKVEKININR